MSRYRIVILFGALLVLGAVVWWAFRSGPLHEHELVAATSPEGEVYWTCPMHPQVHLDAPGNCPICGMKLVKRSQGASEPGLVDANEAVAASRPNSQLIEIDPRMAQNLGMRTAPVIRGNVGSTTTAVGSVTVDETRIFAIESRAAGWVERLEVRAVGEPVRGGQSVASVYSPDLYAAQAELALAARSGDQVLVSAARQRLALLGVPSGQIEQVVQRGEAMRHVAVVSPSDGIVTELNVREGQQVAPAMSLMRIADLSRVWITIELPETQAGVVQAGQKATARLRAVPGRTFSGEVQYVYPRLDPSTRTVSARMAFDNREGELKPGMYADVTLAGGTADGAQRDVLQVPTEAVIRTGTRSVVIVAEATGRYRPAIVELGDERQGQTVVLAGLEEGERVVVSGQFLIDSEASLRGAFDRLGREPPGDRP